MALKSYEIPWRPTHEKWAVFTWALATIYMVALAINKEMPSEPLWAMALVSCIFMLRRTVGMIKQINSFRRIKTGNLWIMPWKKFIKKIPEDGNTIGSGFTWTVEALEKSQEILDSNPEKLLGKKAANNNAYWLHGVKKKKKDLTFTIKAACLAKGEPERYLFFHPAFPDKSVRIDPLRNWNRRTEPASRVTTLIPSESGGSDPFTAFCWKVLNSVSQGLMEAGERPTLVKLRKYIEGDPAPLLIRALRSHFSKTTPNWEERIKKYTKRKNKTEVQSYIDYYNTEVSQNHQSMGLEGLISTVTHNKEHFQKMITSLIPMLSMLTDDALGPLLSPDSSPNPQDPRIITDTKRVIEKGQVLYIALDSLSDATVGSAIGSMILADLASVAGDRYSFGVGDRAVNVFVDEAAEVINEPTVQLMNKGRGAKFRVWIATQTIADFEARLGSEAQARKILGNANTKFVLRVHDDKTQKYFSEQMPEVSVRSLDHQYRTGASSEDPSEFSGMYSETLNKEKGSLVPPSLMGLLPDMHYFAKMADGRVLKGRFPIISLSNLENEQQTDV